MTTKISLRNARARRHHTKARQSGQVRLLVYRSNATIYAQLINDQENKVIAGTSTLKSPKTNVQTAQEIGKNIAKLAAKHKITKVAFDCNGYKYHGQIKAVAEGAREGGLQF